MMLGSINNKRYNASSAGNISRSYPIIPLWLRDTYGRIQPEPIYNLEGPLEENRSSEEAAYRSHSRGISNSDLFLNGGDIFGYINKNKSLCINRSGSNGPGGPGANEPGFNQVITIVIHSLRDLYWNYRAMLSPDQLVQLNMAMDEPLSTFKNIYDYKSLEKFRDMTDTPLYQMFGTITPYSVLYIPVRNFIETINNNEPIQIALDNIGIIIQLDYQQFDFWNFDTQSIVNKIDLSLCK